MNLYAPVMGNRRALLLGPALMDEGSSGRKEPGRKDHDGEVVQPSITINFF